MGELLAAHYTYVHTYVQESLKTPTKREIELAKAGALRGCTVLNLVYMKLCIESFSVSGTTLKSHQDRRARIFN